MEKHKSTETQVEIRHIGILGVGRFVPEARLTNEDLEGMVDTSDEWITVRTGIKERRVASKNERASHLGVAAAKDALKDAGIAGSKIDLIIVATSTPDSNFPSTACLIQKELGAHQAAAFDISAACSGFLYGLATAKQFIATGTAKKALVIAAEIMTSIIDWQDRNTCVLFGDGAGACVLGEVEGGRGFLSEYLHAQGEFCDLMTVVTDRGRHPTEGNGATGIRPYVRMQGRELFKIAVNSMDRAVREAIKKAGVSVEEVACVVPHQANDRIISAVAKKLGIPKEKFFINIMHYGNMSAASCAVALHDAVREKRIKEGDLVVMVSFGAGLVTAANVIRW